MKKQGKRFFALVLALTMLFGLLPVTGEAVFAATGDVAISAKNFPDANFRSFVSTKFDKDKNGILSLTERNAVKSIFVYEKNIKSLKGIEWFPNLDDLSCPNNPITQVDLSGNPKLLIFHCRDCDITQIDFSKNPLLEEAYLALNPLTKVNVSSNSKLQQLDCGGTELTGLNVSRNSALRYLNIDGTKLTQVDLSHNPQLISLSCDKAQLTRLNLSANTKLEYLRCENNKLTQLDLSKNKALKKLYIYGNSITNADFTANTSLANFDYNALQTYRISVNEPGLKFNLSTLPGQFNVSKASNWKGGTVSGSTLTMDPSKPQSVSYMYTAAPGKVLGVSLNVTYIPAPPVPKKTVTLDANDGSGTFFTVSVDAGSKYTLPKNQFTAPTGKAFKAWSVNGVVKAVGDSIVVNADTTVKAVWEPLPAETPPLKLAVFRTGWKTIYKAGETVALAARAEGGTAPYRYQFYVVRSNGSRVVLRNYAYKNTFTWKPVTPDTYTVGVNVKDSTGNTKSREKPVKVHSANPESLEVAVFRTGWQDNYTVGDQIPMAARAEGGTAPYRYQFYVLRPNGPPLILRDYAYSNTFTWVPVVPDVHIVGVNVKDATGKIVSRDKNLWVKRKEASVIQIPVFRTGWKTRYKAGETVALAARAEGGTAPYRYQFYVIRSNGSRVVLRKYAYNNVFTWVPVTPDAYQVGVNIKDSTGLAESMERMVVVEKPD